MKRISPPTGVYAMPVATPGTLVRDASSGSKRIGPSSFCTISLSTGHFSVLPPTISAAIPRHHRADVVAPDSRTPASRV